MGQGPAIRAGATIPEDTELPTVLFQTTISKLRDILAATGRGREDKTIGLMAAINAATQNRRTELLASGAQLNRLIDQLDAIVATEPGPSTVSALIDATRGLQQTAPELVDALHKAVSADADPGGAARTADRAPQRRCAHDEHDLYRR